MKSSQLSQLFSILLLFLLIVGSVLFIFPLRDRIAELRVTEEQVKGDLVVLEQDYAELSALSEQVASSEATRESLSAAVPSGYAQDRLIFELSAIASDLGFKLNSMTFSDTVSEAYGNSVSIYANFTGSYEDLIAFLQKVENSERLMRVLTLNVQRTSTSDVAFNLQIEAYYQ